ncbi:unnamed protein product [Anisakis simplex]|uniref:Thioredoxin domain-containing protein n=1 Tax=Anisakis simplex TaxID=6269 RepID=A0A3P6QGZ3_ANISI|nr:unnamed protein product [Anisakis simplex]
MLIDPSDGRLARRRAAPPIPFFSSSYPSTTDEDESQSLKDYYDGNGAHSSLLLRSSELVIAFYYATWSLDSKLARNAFQNVAKSFDGCDDISFAAVNCFTTHGQCRNSYKVGAFPIIVAYVSTNLKSVRDVALIYNGELVDDYIRREYFVASLIAAQYEELLGGVRFAIVTEWRLAHWLKFTHEGHIQLFQQGEAPMHFPLARNYSSLEITYWIRDYSLTHSTSLHWLVPEQLLTKLQSAPTLILFTARQPLYAHKSEVSIVEQTAMEYLDCSEAYTNQIQQTLKIREKYRQKRIKLLEMDHIACKAIKTFKTSLVQVIACCHNKYNELVDYCGRCIRTLWWNSPAQNVHSTYRDECTKKTVLFNLKSSPICGNLFDSSTLSSERPSNNQSIVVEMCCLLTEMESVYGERRRMTSQKMQQRCNNYRMRRGGGAMDRISTSDLYFESTDGDSSHLKKNNERSHTDSNNAPRRADSDENADDKSIHESISDGQQRRQQQYDSLSVAHLSCSYNNSLRFMAIDTQHYGFLIEKLAINSPSLKSSANEESNVIIVDGINEQIFVMQETLTRDTLKKFVASYHNGLLSRHQISEEKLAKQLKATSNEQLTSNKKNINKINTTSANTFMSGLLNKNSSQDMVVLLINGAWHGPSSSVFYIFHTVAYYFKPFESMINFVMFVIAYHTVSNWTFQRMIFHGNLKWIVCHLYCSFYQKGAESASSAMPRDWSMSVPGLISFIISRCGTELRWRLALSSCSSVCMRNNTIMLKRRARIINNHIHQLRTLQNSFTFTKSQSSLLKTLILRFCFDLILQSDILVAFE